MENLMTGLEFTVEKMFKLPDAGNLKAFADVRVNDCMVIRGVRIVDSKRGLFVSMPQEQGKDNRWYDQVIFKSAAVYDQFSAVVIAHYNQA